MTLISTTVGKLTVAGKNWKWNNRLVTNWERNRSRLYIVTLLI